MKHFCSLLIFALFATHASSQERICDKDAVFNKVFTAYEGKITPYILRIAHQKWKDIDDKEVLERNIKETISVYQEKIQALKAKSYLQVQQQDCKANDLELTAYVAGFLSSTFQFQIFYEEYEVIGEEFANSMTKEISKLLKK
jgi:hypothetical protein